MFCRCFKSSIGQRHELVVTKNVRRLGLHDSEHLRGQFPDFHLGMATASELDEMPERSRIGRDENLRFRRVGSTLRAAWRASLRRAVRSGSDFNFSCNFSAKHIYARWL